MIVAIQNGIPFSTDSFTYAWINNHKYGYKMVTKSMGGYDGNIGSNIERNDLSDLKPVFSKRDLNIADL